MWFFASQHLYLKEELWPQDITNLDCPPEEAASEIKQPKAQKKVGLHWVCVGLHQDNDCSDDVESLSGAFSTFLKYLKFVQVFRKFLDNLRDYVADVQVDRKSAVQKMERQRRMVSRALASKKVNQASNVTHTKEYFRAVVAGKKSPKLEQVDEQFSISVTYTVTLHEAKVIVIRQAQQDQFSDEIRRLSLGQSVLQKSVLFKHGPILDEEGILRVAGRFAPCERAKHLIVLPQTHPLTTLVVKDVHERSLGHVGGVNWNANQIKKDYWILHLQKEVKRMLAKCYECARRYPKPFEQQMGPLHDARLPGSYGEGESPFAFAGGVSVDFAGPWLTKQGQRQAREKRYLAIFTCQLARAVHLEMVPSLEAADCLLAFLKFLNRRGFPERIISDNGGNLVRTEKELSTVRDSLGKVREKVLEMALDFPKFEWIWCGERTPHQNGAVERMVSVVKRSMNKLSVVNPKTGALTDHELDALFIRVEGLMNARPLTPTVTNTGGDQVLTPNHFIVGNGNNSPVRLAVPDAVRKDLLNQYNFRWYRVEEAAEEFWQRMNAEFLEQSRKRGKWNTGCPDINPGDLVMVLDAANDALRWPLAKVLELELDKEGRVQTVKILFRGTETRRGVRSLAPVPFTE